MKARGMLYKPEMIRAKLEGRKSQTRRIVKPQPSGEFSLGRVATKEAGIGIVHNQRYEGELLHCDFIKCPYGKVGDILYAKESVCRMSHFDWIYKVDDPHASPTWRSPLFMPKQAARIIDEITEIRVERVEDISWNDAVSEGMTEDFAVNFKEYQECGMMLYDPVDMYLKYINHINKGKVFMESWVWVITTKNLSLTGWEAIN